MSSAFPFESLAPELQMLILCKCDLESTRCLINLCPTIKALFLHHPQTYLRDIVRNQGQLGNLVCLAWLLDTVPSVQLCPQYIIEFLGKMGDVGSMSVVNPWISARDDSLVVLYELADAMEEVDEMVNLYADSVLAILDVVSSLDACHSSIDLSSTEYARIAAAFLLLRIYTGYIGLQGDRRVFMNTLPVWLLEFMVAVNAFFEGVGRRTGSELHYLVDAKLPSRRTLCDASTYAWRYYETWPDPGVLASLWLTLEGRGGDATPTGVPSMRFVRANDAGNENYTHVADDLTSEGIRSGYGWDIVHSIADDVGMSIRYYRRIFLHLGLLFWDEDRFLHIPMTSVDEYLALVERFEAACRRAHVHAYNEIFRDVEGLDERAVTALGRRAEREDILAWTRSAVQYTFGEWMMRL